MTTGHSTVLTVTRFLSSVQEASGSGSSSGSSSSDSDGSGAARQRGNRIRRGVSSEAPRKAAGPQAPRAPTGLTVNRDGTLATASAAELRIASELAKDPWGRWERVGAGGPSRE